MAATRTNDLLAQIPLFQGLSKRDLGKVASLMTPVEVESGRVLVRQGQIGREFFVIVRGTARVERDGRLVNTLGPGDWFGEIALLDSARRAATVTATTDMQLEVLSRSEFTDLLDSTPEVTRKLLRGLARIVEGNSLG
jgi:CRP/FNR family cyclic AMP-dependent transcriptional regulator